MRYCLPVVLVLGVLSSLSLSLTAPHTFRRRHPSLSSTRSHPRSRIPRTTQPPTFHPSTQSLKLTRLVPRDPSLHPTVRLQQHLNRSLRRHARMTKRAALTDADLERRLRRRMASVTERGLRKRGWRGGMAMAGLVGLQDSIASLFTKGRQNHKSGNGSEAPTTPGSSNGTAHGFPQAVLDAATDNTVAPAETPQAAHSIGLDIEANDVGYFGTVQIGTPAQDFKILMDSGSADFWVPSQACTDCGPHTTLGSSVSSSFKTTGQPFQVTYGTGDVQGQIITDDVSIAGLKLSAHAFGVVTAESVDFSDPSVPFDGLMGLAQSTLSNQGVPTPIESLATAGVVQSAQMGFHLASVTDAAQDSEITFGGVDASKFSGSLTEFPNVNTQGFWEGAVDAVSVNGASLGLRGRTAILDTGTTLIVMPAADAAAVHDAIPGSASDGQGGFTIPCTTSASVAFTFSGTSFAINPKDLTFLPVTDDLMGDCISGISSGSVGGATEWLVGDVFLKGVYFATDVGSNTIGLARSVTATA